jgi:hypothetical protein
MADTAVSGRARTGRVGALAVASLPGFMVMAGGDARLAQAQDQSVLRIIPHADLRNIDPIWTTAYITRNHGYLGWDTLFALYEDLEVQPQMVVYRDNLSGVLPAPVPFLGNIEKN